jgi:hypothetical protein
MKQNYLESFENAIESNTKDIKQKTLKQVSMSN